MSFKRINSLCTTNNERSFVIVYNFNAKDTLMIKNILKLLGIKDVCTLNKDNANSKIEDIIKGNIDDTCSQCINQRAVIFNNVAHTKISGFSDNLRKFKINRPLMAVVTEDNISWSLNTLIDNLINERNAINSGNTLNH
ncbi:DUF3783 domain-containing protein [Romboutsia sp. 1001713B170131_170501_G6]|uniref:DUF3783 domain-containing protein n=1 Tax=Romboutsia sp. 1001713B170131_170501_G6 TaxID=2787108 RepID=UPI0018A97157|nr:DUF3783 domain-containing protein [Romboutsia sp. 1001713B170131_170501_G6]